MSHEEMMLKDIRERYELGDDPTKLMDDMEYLFKIPLLNDDEWNAKHPEVIELYRKISYSRDL